MKKYNFSLFIYFLFMPFIHAQLNGDFILGIWNEVYIVDTETGEQTVSFEESDIKFLPNGKVDYQPLFGQFSYQLLAEESIIKLGENYQMNIALLTENSLIFTLGEQGKEQPTGYYYVYSKNNSSKETPDIKAFFSTPPSDDKEAEKVFKTVDVQPYFQGCEKVKKVEKRKKCADEKMLIFIYSNLKYPSKAREQKIEGDVHIKFNVEKDGSLSNFEILKDIGAGCGEESVRVIKMMPNWNPALVEGKPVRVQIVLPVKFRLE